MSSDTLNVTDLRHNLNHHLNRVEFKGETLTLFRHGRKAAKLVPIGSDVNVADPTIGLVPTIVPAETAGKTPAKTPGKPQNGGKNPGKTR